MATYLAFTQLHSLPEQADYGDDDVPLLDTASVGLRAADAKFYDDDQDDDELHASGSRPRTNTSVSRG